MTAVSSATAAAVVLVGGCGGDGGSGAGASAGASASGKPAEAPAKGAPAKDAQAKGTLVERAAGSWKSIGTPGDDTLDTLTVTGGKLTAKGAKLSCTGTIAPEPEKDGKETASVMLTCEGGKDGGRGPGHLQVKPDGSALYIDYDGPKGGWGGPTDSYRRG
ncbi:hypothetical protein AB0C81_31720 [Streptomyces roseoverticillatus]|uniref:hypothetical protein n=1 Tax=Streptomyces roseoverticillatus TaxID=66429 RepID=UPI0033E9C028